MVPRPRRRPPPSLGANAMRNGKPVRLTASEVHRLAKQAQHGACVEHVKLAGTSVCIRRGDDRAAVLAAAAELLS
jgi:hypothetical protein